MAIKTKEDKVDEYYELVALVNRYRGRYGGLHALTPSEALKVILQRMEKEINSKKQNPLLILDPETGEVRNMSRIDIGRVVDVNLGYPNVKENEGVTVTELELKYEEPEKKDTDFDWNLESLAGIDIEEDI